MKIFHIIALFTVGGFMTASTLCASTRTCRVVYPERPNDAPKIAYIFDGELNHRVSLPSMNLSEVIELPEGKISIAMTAGEILDPEALPENLPLLRIPENVTNFYILITPDPENAEFPIKMHMVNAGGGKLKPGETLWFNLTPHRIAAKLGGTDMSVDPGKRAISKDPKAVSGYYIARFAYQVNGKGEYARITEQSWWHDAKSRHLGFIAGTGGRLPKIYFYRDYRQ